MVGVTVDHPPDPIRDMAVDSMDRRVEGQLGIVDAEGTAQSLATGTWMPLQTTISK